MFGIATAAMNTFFYLAIDRTDLGKSVAIEFIGPIAVAAVMTRTRRNAGALALAAVGVVVLGGVELDGNTAGLLWLLAASSMWAVYIVFGSRVAQVGRGVAGLGIGLAIGAVALTPFGAPGSGPVWASPRLLVRLPPRRRVLQRHRLRHRPARPAADPGAPVLGAPRPAPGDGRDASAGSPSTRPRPALDLAGIALVLAGVMLQEREEVAAELAAPDPG